MALNLPANTQTWARIVGIDPGSTNLGFAVMDFDIVSRRILSTHAFTVRCEKAITGLSYSEIFGNRLGRIDAMRQALYGHFLHFQPNFVISETPFMGNHAAAYGALVETLGGIREALAMYDPFMPLQGIDPPSAKRAVGAAGNAKKPQMQEAVGKLLNVIQYNSALSGDFYSLDEHSVDAIAIAKTLHNWLEKMNYNW